MTQINFQWYWLNTHPEGESLFSVCPNSINWQHWLNTHPGGGSFSLHNQLFIIISWLSFLQAHDLAIFLNVYYNKSKNTGLPSYFKFMLGKKFPVSSIIFFTGLMNLSFLLLLFIFLIAFLIPTGLLICMENTFWNGLLGPDNFVESFKQSFKLYVDSGMKKKVEAEIDILRNEQGESDCPLTEDFRARFHKLVIDHYLRKIHCFYIHLTHLTTSFA